jgi:hypothetical protein
MAAGGPAQFAARLAGSNINQESYLATDYLNHFNEIIMIIGLIPEMPCCLEEARSWSPKSYVAHFRESALSNRELAIEAYHRAPAHYRLPFDDTVEAMDRLVVNGLVALEDAAAKGQDGRVAELVLELSSKLQRLIDRASAIIHGHNIYLDQDGIDQILSS